MSKYFSFIYSGDVTTAPNKKILPAEAFSQLLSVNELLNQAKEDIAAYLEKNQEACQKILEETKEAGFNEGLFRFNEYILYYEKQLKQIKLDLQNQVLSLALKIAKKILPQELELNPESIIAIVMQVLKPVIQNRHIKIFVSKNDRDVLEQKKQEIRKIFEHVETFIIEEKEDLESGDCVIETEAGIINARLKNQWDAIEAAFNTFMKT